MPLCTIVFKTLIHSSFHINTPSVLISLQGFLKSIFLTFLSLLLVFLPGPNWVHLLVCVSSLRPWVTLLVMSSPALHDFSVRVQQFRCYDFWGVNAFWIFMFLVLWFVLLSAWILVSVYLRISLLSRLHLRAYWEKANSTSMHGTETVLNYSQPTSIPQWPRQMESYCAVCYKVKQ